VCAAEMKMLMTMMLALAFVNSVVGGGGGLPTEGDLSLATVAWLLGGGATPLSDDVAAACVLRHRCYCCHRCAIVVRGRVAS